MKGENVWRFGSNWQRPRWRDRNRAGKLLAQFPKTAPANHPEAGAVSFRRGAGLLSPSGCDWMQEGPGEAKVTEAESEQIFLAAIVAAISDDVPYGFQFRIVARSKNARIVKPI